MMAALNTRAVELNHRERMLEDRQQAFVNAAMDMKAFAERIYGPDSELTKINQKLGGIEASGTARDKRYADRFQVIDENQTRFKDSVDERFKQVHSDLTKLSDRVTNLEKAG
jgi:hypothetical protein